MIGDSLAVGVGQARPECETIARVGITSERYIATMLPPGRTTVETAVISLGVNDDDSVDTLGNLREVRARIVGKAVYWLLPGIKERVREIILTVAAENGDRLLDTRPHVGRDHLHPNGAGYQLLAARTIGDGGDGGDGEEVAMDVPRVRYSYRTEDVRRHLSAYATPRERIGRLHALRRAEGSRGAPVSVGMRANAAALRVPIGPVMRGGGHSVAAPCIGRACGGRTRTARG